MRPAKAYSRERLDAIEAAAQRLWTAASSHHTVAPLRGELEPHDLEGAYAVQDVNTKRRIAAGHRVVGYKIGLTSVALQQRLGIDEPDFGILFDDMEVADGGTLAPRTVLQPRVEGEIALVLGRDVTSETVTATQIAEAVALALPAIEIVGSRIADWAITAADTIADNASAGAFVLGGTRRPFAPQALAEARMTMRIDGDVVGEGLGSAALGDPLEALAWLARTAVARGHPLRAGDVVLSGALAPMVPLPAGGLVEVDVTGLGSVSFRASA
jgi:2-keto-4-pentenoate hydratase